jgi:hypothetical protein
LREQVLSLLFIDEFFAECVFNFIVDFLFVLATKKCEARPNAINFFLFRFLNVLGGFNVDVFVICNQLVNLTLLILDNVDGVTVFEVENILFVPTFISFVEHMQNLVT